MVGVLVLCREEEEGDREGEGKKRKREGKRGEEKEGLFRWEIKTMRPVR